MIKDNVLLGKERQAEPDFSRRVDTRDIPPGKIRPRHLEFGLFAVKFGLAVDRPETGEETRAYFATDTGAFSCWTGTEWLSTIFT